jgi:hypothetical protein
MLRQMNKNIVLTITYKEIYKFVQILLKWTLVQKY